MCCRSSLSLMCFSDGAATQTWGLDYESSSTKSGYLCSLASPTRPSQLVLYSMTQLRVSHEGGGVCSKWTPVDPTVVTLKVHVSVNSHGVYLQFYSVSCNMSICKCNSTSFKTKLVGRCSSGVFSGSKQLQFLVDRRRSDPDLTRWGSRLDRV